MDPNADQRLVQDLDAEPGVHGVRQPSRQDMALPGAHLVWMHLVLRGDLLDRLVAPQRFQRHASLEFSAKPPSRRHCISLRYTAEYTLTPYPIF